MSTKDKPKQFIDVLGVGRTLIQLTYDRFEPICPPENVWVVTNKKYVDIAMKMLKSLSDKYNLCGDESSNAILSDAMYSKPHGHKAEANIWGDYFYMEALMRVINPDWVVYW